MILKQQIKRISSCLGDVIRICGMRFILPLAARFVPRRMAMLTADAIALSLCLLPVPGRAALEEMKRAFGGSTLSAFRLAWGWLGRPLRDFVACKRLLCGHDQATSYRVIEKNVHSINELRASGESYIVACGHFVREAAIALYLPRVTPAHILHVSRNPSMGTLRGSRIRLQLETLLDAAQRLRNGNLSVVFTGPDASAAGTLYTQLKAAGNVVFVYIDAPFGSGRAGFLTRPFAGSSQRLFSMGAVRLARLTRCPLIECIWWQEDDGTFVVEWGDVIRLPDSASAKGDAQVLSTLLDRLEIAIGRRPAQYVLDIGDERRWDSMGECWR